MNVCVTAYGLTEASPGTHCHTDEDVKYHTAGVAFQNTQFKVLGQSNYTVSEKQYNREHSVTRYL